MKPIIDEEGNPHSMTTPMPDYRSAFARAVHIEIDYAPRGDDTPAVAVEAAEADGWTLSAPWRKGGVAVLRNEDGEVMLIGEGPNGVSARAVVLAGEPTAEQTGAQLQLSEEHAS